MPIPNKNEHKATGSKRTISLGASLSQDKHLFRKSFEKLPTERDFYIFATVFEQYEGFDTTSEVLEIDEKKCHCNF